MTFRHRRIPCPLPEAVDVVEVESPLGHLQLSEVPARRHGPVPPAAVARRRVERRVAVVAHGVQSRELAVGLIQVVARGCAARRASLPAPETAVRQGPAQGLLDLLVADRDEPGELGHEFVGFVVDDLPRVGGGAGDVLEAYEAVGLLVRALRVLSFAGDPP